MSGFGPVIFSAILKSSMPTPKLLELLDNSVKRAAELSIYPFFSDTQWASPSSRNKFSAHGNDTSRRQRCPRSEEWENSTSTQVSSRFCPTPPFQQLYTDRHVSLLYPALNPRHCRVSWPNSRRSRVDLPRPNVLAMRPAGFHVLQVSMNSVRLSVSNVVLYCVI